MAMGKMMNKEQYRFYKKWVLISNKNATIIKLRVVVS
jgi:hypothetical protein